MAILLRIALNNLVAAKRRTLFLGTALFLVTLLFVLLLSLTAGVTDTVVRAATSISSGHVNIGGYYKATAGDSQTIVTGTPKHKALAKEVLGDDLIGVVDRLRGWGKIISDQSTEQAGLTGVSYAEETDLFTLLSQAPMKEYVEGNTSEKVNGTFADLQKPNTIVLFAKAAKRLKVDVGDRVTLRTETLRGASNTAEVTVVAIARDLGLLSGFAAFVDKQTIIELYQYKPDVTGVIQLYLKDIAHSTNAMNMLREAYAKQGTPQLEHDAQPFFMKLLQTVPQEDWTGAKIDVTTWEDEASYLMQLIAALKASSFSLVMLLAIVIVIGITNTMTIAVRERTKEIGTLRAIGMGRSRVLALFLLEASVLGVLATTLGAVFGLIVASAIEAAHITVDSDAMRVVLLSDAVHLVPRISDALTAIITLTFVSAAAAVLPSLRAARITPVTAMQSAE